MERRTLRRRVCGCAIGSVAMVTLAGVGASPATSLSAPRLGFTPITTNALPCSANGLIEFANDAKNEPVTPTLLMQAGDPAAPVNAPATSNAVGRVNDMIALSPDGRYLFTSSENSIPSENGVGTNGSDGITRLTLRGRDRGKKEILANNVDAITGANLWQRVDGTKWYPHGGPGDEGVLLASEEFAAGGIWQVNPLLALSSVVGTATTRITTVSMARMRPAPPLASGSRHWRACMPSSATPRSATRCGG